VIHNQAMNKKKVKVRKEKKMSTELSTNAGISELNNKIKSHPSVYARVTYHGYYLFFLTVKLS